MLFGILFVVFLLIAGSYALGGYSAAPWVPAWSHDVERFCDAAQISPSDIVYELGCGDGRILAAAARHGARGVGYEISLLPFCIAWLRARFVQPHPRILLKNFWTADLSEATVVILFLLPEPYKKLQPKLQRELKPGTRVVCYVWPMLGWTPIRTDLQPGRPAIRVYEMPNPKGSLPTLQTSTLS